VIAAGGKPILLAHFGRPKGQRIADMSLSVVFDALADASKRTDLRRPLPPTAMSSSTTRFQPLTVPMRRRLESLSSCRLLLVWAWPPN